MESKTYYLDITSSSLQLWLKISKWLEGRLWLDDFGIMQNVPYGIWFNGDETLAKELVDYAGVVTHECVEVFDSAGTLVASTHPTDHPQSSPPHPGKYLCYTDEWEILEWDGENWQCAVNTPVRVVARWLHLPHKNAVLTK